MGERAIDKRNFYDLLGREVATSAAFGLEKSMKIWLQVLFVLFLMYGIPVGLLFAFSERPELTGHTDLSRFAATDGQHPGDNYAVFRKGRFIRITGDLLPVEIKEDNGRLVRVVTLLSQGRLPVRFHTPASPAEEALWRQYF